MIKDLADIAHEFEFKSLTVDDLVLLYQWFQEKTVNQWYARGKFWSINEIHEKYEPRLSNKERIPSFIIYHQDLALGFIQYYSLVDYLPEGIAENNNMLFQKYSKNTLVGMDLFIALSSFRGKGIGPEIINQFINEHLSGCSAVVVDPDAKNHAAIRCYEKAGFKQTKYSDNPNYLILINSLGSIKNITNY
jgi:aminoglycoside 6'-N-acetyltransferase